MAIQYFKRNLLLTLYREGKKISLVCFLLRLREIKNVWHLQPVSSVWRPRAFLPVTLSLPKVKGWKILHLFSAMTQVMDDVHHGIHSHGHADILNNSQYATGDCILFLLSRKHQITRESHVVIRITANPLF